MDPFISGLIIAAISAAAFVAYKHPEGFRALEFVVSISLSIVMIGLTIWNTSAAVLFLRLNIPVDKMAAGKEVLAEHQLFEGYLLISWTAIYAYLTVLRFLPRFGIVEKKEVGGPEAPR